MITNTILLLNNTIIKLSLIEGPMWPKGFFLKKGCNGVFLGIDYSSVVFQKFRGSNPWLVTIF